MPTAVATVQSMTETTTETLIIGAGLAGLVAARRLAESGQDVVVVDKGRSVGGRLATRRVGDAVLDHGAQFFTVRSDEFRAAVDEWLDAGVIHEWCRGFEADDGYPRYVASAGMNALGKHLATQAAGAGVEIVTGVRAEAIERHHGSWVTTYHDEARMPDKAPRLLLTAPVPQSLALLDAGRVAISAHLAAVREIRYHPVVGLLTTTDEPPVLGSVGALQQPDDPTFTFIADNQAKGISPVPAVTFHCAHGLSSDLWDLTDDQILDRLQPLAQTVLGDVAIGSAQVKKWLYAGPVEPWPDRAVLLASDPGPLALAGDAFGGPKVEGAFLSGVAAAELLLA